LQLLARRSRCLSQSCRRLDAATPATGKRDKPATQTPGLRSPTKRPVLQHNPPNNRHCRARSALRICANSGLGDRHISGAGQSRCFLLDRRGAVVRLSRLEKNRR
jgi:hypothetical protein